MSRSLRSCLGLVALAIAITACGSGGSSTAQIKRAVPPATTATTLPPPTTTRVPAYITYIATVQPTVTNIGVFSSRADPQPSMVLPNPWLYDANDPNTSVPQVFLVKSLDPNGWVEVLLPVRPNGSTGWVHVTDVSLTPDPYHVVVSLGAHTVTVTKATDVVYSGPVAVGAPETPTPTGSYYLYVLLQSPDPTGPYGPFAYGLSSHSDALATFAGGDAEIGLHGNADASVLGQSVSHGCVRMDNNAISMLASLLPLGTPVDITA